MAARPRILLVEDEMAIALMLEDLLSSLGYDVVGPVGRVREAIALVEREAMDAALLDVNLGGEKVYAVADTLAARDIPFVFVTGYGAAGLPAPYRDRPSVPKPFKRRALALALAAVCGVTKS
jgi:CheY-like chemotaxis protein